MGCKIPFIRNMGGEGFGSCKLLKKTAKCSKLYAALRD